MKLKQSAIVIGSLALAGSAASFADTKIYPGILCEANEGPEVGDFRSQDGGIQNRSNRSR